jgi:hypothetical protein
LRLRKLSSICPLPPVILATSSVPCALRAFAVKNPAGVVRAIFVLAGSASRFVKQHCVLHKRRKGFQFLLALPARL